MTAIFLDIDHVENDGFQWPNGYSPIQYDKVQVLNIILDAVPEAKIILSSAWRYAFETPRAIEALLLCHGANCFGRVLGATKSDEWAHGGPMPAFSDNNREWFKVKGLEWRVAQIIAEVEARQIKRFVVLDDLPLDVPNLVQTRRDVGLTAADAERAIRVLRGEQ